MATIPVESYGHAVLLKLSGEQNADVLDLVSQTVNHELEHEEVIDVVFDMSEVAFLDSAVLEYLLDLQDRLVERFGRVRFAHCGEEVKKILEITRLIHEFDIFEDVDSAVKSMGL